MFILNPRLGIYRLQNIGFEFQFWVVASRLMDEGTVRQIGGGFLDKVSPLSKMDLFYMSRYGFNDDPSLVWRPIALIILGFYSPKIYFSMTPWVMVRHSLNDSLVRPSPNFFFHFLLVLGDGKNDGPSGHWRSFRHDVTSLVSLKLWFFLSLSSILEKKHKTH